MTITLTRLEAQQVLDALNTVYGAPRYEASKILRAKLSEPEPEPVAVWELQEGGWDTIADRDWMESLPVGTKLYTAPPQRDEASAKAAEWVGLTDEELLDLADMAYANDLELLQTLQAKLKEKNYD